MSFADLELLRQGVRLEPLLQAICNFLDKQPAPMQRKRCFIPILQRRR
jgi:transposase, IS5 family